MRVVVTSLAHGRFITKQVFSPPGDNMSLTGWDIRTAVRATVRLFSAVRRDITHEPFVTTERLFAGAAIGQPGYVSWWS